MSINKNISVLVLLFTMMVSRLSAQNLTDGPGSVLWKVKNPKTENVSYILGSIHTYGGKWLDSFSIIDSLVSSQNVFICENTLSIDTLERNKFTKETFKNKEDKKLFGNDLELVRSHFIKTTDIDIDKLLESAKKSDSYIYTIYYILLYEFAKKDNLKVSPDFIPMDDLLLRKAFLDKKTCIGLDNLQTLNNLLSAKKNVSSLKYTIIDLVKHLEDMELPQKRKKEFRKYLDMMNAYNDGKFVFDSDSMSNDGVKAVTRNKIWMKSLPDFVTDKNCFITVGIIHLNGKEGILRMLQDQGFELSQIKLK